MPTISTNAESHTTVDFIGAAKTNLCTGRTIRLKTFGGGSMNGSNAVQPDYWKRAKITHAMADSRRESWESLLWPYRSEIHRVLEIGSYEGQSALFWHHHFSAEVFCVDNWQHFADGCKNGVEAERHFDENVRGLPIIKRKAETSTHALIDMPGEFDLVYVDGDHSRLQVMIDTCLAWRLLRPGGIMIWDDFRDYRPDLIDRPTPAINAFIEMLADQIVVVKDTGQQLIVQKIG